MKIDRQELGKLGEDMAADYLAKNGYHILARNWRYRHLELDIICAFEEAIIFIEVKTRSGSGFGGAALAVTPQKQRKLIMAALAWLQCTHKWNMPCRFDVVCLTGSISSPCLEHFRNAFDISRFMDCRHSAW